MYQAACLKFNLYCVTVLADAVERANDLMKLPRLLLKRDAEKAIANKEAEKLIIQPSRSRISTCRCPNSCYSKKFVKR